MNCPDPSSLLGCFSAGLTAAPDQICLDVEGRKFTYKEMASAVALAQRKIASIQDDKEVAVVYTGREPALFIGILTCLACDKGYVPISPDLPHSRARTVLANAGATMIFTSPANLTGLRDMLGSDGDDFILVVLCADATEFPDAVAVPYSEDAIANAPQLTMPEPVHDIAYLMFTSGSTGAPKGVPITHKNARQFVDTMQRRYKLVPEDRVICLPDFYFDLSIFPIWVTWNAGAAIFVPGEKDKMMPARYAAQHNITVWCSVPSSISFLVNFNVLKSGMFPNIRLSIFCGEPLLKSDCKKWLDACPKSRVENLYGPTEVTVFSTTFPVTHETVDHGKGDIVSIGKPLEGVSVCIVDDALVPLPSGSIGELCLAGGQVTPGYWGQPDLTYEKFCTIENAPSGEDRWYRTGDLAVETEGGTLVFKGRADDQVQVSGYRVELGDIEQAAREVAGVVSAAAVFEKSPGGKSASIFMFATGANISPDEIQAQIAEKLPSYMVPKQVIRMNQMPQNKNGKTDKVALKRMIQEGI